MSTVMNEEMTEGMKRTGRGVRWEGKGAERGSLEGAVTSKVVTWKVPPEDGEPAMQRARAKSPGQSEHPVQRPCVRKECGKVRDEMEDEAEPRAHRPSMGKRQEGWLISKDEVRVSGPADPALLPVLHYPHPHN